MRVRLYLSMIALATIVCAATSKADPIVEGYFFAVSDGYVPGSETPVKSVTDSSGDITITAPTSLSFNATEPYVIPNCDCFGVPPAADVPYATSVSANLNFFNQPSPSIYLSGTTSAVNGTETSSSFQMGVTEQYSLEIFGPTAAVPVLVQANGGVNIGSLPTDPLNGNVQLSASFVVSGGMGGITDSSTLNVGGDLGDYTGPMSEGFSENGVDNLLTGSIYNISISASIIGDANGMDAGYGAGGTTTLSAFVDPIFTIAADDPSDYTIVLSNGIGNSVALDVPEPASITILIVGLIGVVSVTHHRQVRN